MRYLILTIFILLFSACSPKYKIVKEYHSPKQTADDKLCLGICQTKKIACKSKCKSSFDICKIKANKVAQKRYADKMNSYINALEDYVNRIDEYNYHMSFAYFEPIGYPYYGDPFYHDRFFMDRMLWYDPVYIPKKPKKPSLEAERLKAQAEICQLDCGCQKLYDECFINCGGSIINKKICIENCPNEK